MQSAHTKTTKKVKTTPYELVSGVVRLVSLPEVCIRVNEMLEDVRVNASDIGKIICQDTGLTARLLKIVNSAFYGFPSRIETVSRAVTVIGLRELRGLVLAASAVEAFSKIPNEILNMVKFWRHSVYCGVVAQLLAERCHVLHSERLFVAGMLHDIGKLILCHRLPKEMAIVVERCKSEDRPDYEIEHEVFGFDHTEVGGELLKVWQMPKTLEEAVRHHHQPNEADEAIMDVCLIHIANGMTLMAENGLELYGETGEISDYAWQTTNLDPSVMDDIFHDAGNLFSEALESILPRSYRPY
ncbi:Predicted signal transduction protein [hydrothermal vent metagenome]|uniref:Predicted signal transduction protein n=1 Tax=hydrothermal vent metagenome TaxID=652676 RepID=A0A3B1A509_9ZZZZ